jgi:hypothetical protein
MQTSLPDLPFPTIGIQVDPSMPKSAAKTTPRTFPRTDLKTFKLWTSFVKDIEEVICTTMADHNLLPGTPLTVGNLYTEPTEVQNEEALRGHVNGELNPAIRGVVRVLGIEGLFVLPGSGNVALVGEPDFSWVSGGKRMHPKLVVCNSLPTLRAHL